MTPEAFIVKWKAADLKERSAAQEHFLDLCRLLDEPSPAEADPTGESYCFERGATKTTGAKGWADVWKRGHFGWEYKGRGGDLRAAFAQLQQYAIALENPPLLVVCDLDRFRIHTNWNNTVSVVHEVTLDDLLDTAARRKLKAVLSDPEQLRPGKTRQALTEEAASNFARLAQRLRERGHAPDVVAHFINRLIFCMFAEDIGLLPNKMFARMLDQARMRPEQFADMARSLFAAMRSGGMVGFETVEWFNGGLFDDDTALALERDEIELAIKVAVLDWAEIDPSIFGTLFERGLDPDKRSQLGAHYTDREKIMMIIEPVVLRTLVAEWEITKKNVSEAINKAKSAKSASARTKAQSAALTLYRGFLDRLRRFSVLDPACGSGNFLYLALRALKDIENRVMIEAEAMGFQREFPQIGPASVKGIEINPYAAELARVTVWIGEIQWMIRNGFGATRNPILKSLKTIECRDALLNPDGTEAEWPEADVIIGNPPFLGGKLLRRLLGDQYVDTLFNAYAGRIPSEADLVTYWFEKAGVQISSKKSYAAGFVSTNSIRGAFNRRVLERVALVAPIYEAWSDEPWVVEGAAVRVSLVCFGNKAQETRLNGLPVPRINTDLSASNVDVTLARPLPENSKTCFQGPVKVGDFDIDGAEARSLLRAPKNVNGRPNSDVVRPWANGIDLVRRPLDKWIIDFGDLSQEEASYYEAPFKIVEQRVKPVRALNRDRQRRENWWRLGRSGADLREATAGLSRVILTPRVSKHRIFVWRSALTLPDSRVVAIAREDDTTFGILHSKFHEAWSLRLGGWHGVGNDPQYTPSSGFETFPFPDGLTPDLPAKAYERDRRAIQIARVSRRLEELRRNWLNPSELVRIEPEVIAGVPDRVVAVDSAAEEVLRTRTLTQLYNEMPKWLQKAHEELDRAVADAYGWAPDISVEDALERLLELNQFRSDVGTAKEIESVDSLKRYMRRMWGASPVVNDVFKVIDTMIAEPQLMARIEMTQIAGWIDKEVIDENFVTLMNILTSGRSRPLNLRLSFDDGTNKIDLDPVENQKRDDILALLSSKVGIAIEDIDEHLFPYFVPTSVFYRLRVQ